MGVTTRASSSKNKANANPAAFASLQDDKVPGETRELSAEGVQKGAPPGLAEDAACGKAGQETADQQKRTRTADSSDDERGYADLPIMHVKLDAAARAREGAARQNELLQKLSARKKLRDAETKRREEARADDERETRELRSQMGLGAE